MPPPVAVPPGVGDWLAAAAGVVADPLAASGLGSVHPRPVSVGGVNDRSSWQTNLQTSRHSSRPFSDPSQASDQRASQPHWLGDPDRHLYAVLHPSAVPGARLGVLLVPPLFHEQPRSRRLLVEVAAGLAAIGLPSMRFDFFGTADSAGSCDQLDFDSMCLDLDVAMRALQAESGVAQVAVLAWRGGALPLARWLRQGAAPARVVLWEPVLDGAQWLRDLERQDAAERCSADRYRVVRPLVDAAGDSQLMGVAVSPRLRSDIAGARLVDDGSLGDRRCWAVLRPDSPRPALLLERVFELPADVPTFGGSTRMDSGLFITAQLKRIADGLGHALWEDR